MKNIFLLLALTSCLFTFCQGKYFTQNGTIGFEASVPSFEEVAAKNNSVTAILNTENGEFAAIAFVKGFRFKNALMEEHFNENYAESDDFPKATFRGKIKDFDMNAMTEGPMAITISGELEFHGEKKNYDLIEVILSMKDNKINLTGAFIANTSDFNIKIPKIVSSKVKNEVSVTVNLVLEKR